MNKTKGYLIANFATVPATVPGFIALERFQSLTTPGKILSLSWWEDEESVVGWKRHLRYQAAQEEGKASIFSFYRIRVARVFREYTASGHLTRLLHQGLVMCLAQRRHRYYRLAGPKIAGLVENLVGVSMHAYAAPVSRTPEHLRYAKTCFDHLAGKLAVKIYHYLQEENCLVVEGTALTPLGNAHFQRLGATLSLRARR